MSNDNYATDESLMAMFGDWFDPCPLNPDPDVDGLTMSWQNKTFVNPPYSHPAPWVDKAIEEQRKGHTVVMLLRVDTSTQWYAKLHEAGAVVFWIHRRLRFRTGKPANFASMLVLLPGKEEVGR